MKFPPPVDRMGGMVDSTCTGIEILPCKSITGTGGKITRLGEKAYKIFTCVPP